MKQLIFLCTVLFFCSCKNEPKILSEVDTVEIDYKVCNKKTQNPVTGTVISYDFSGNKIAERHYVKGLEHGKSIEYDPATGKVKWEWSFVNGSFEGTTTSYHKDGSKASITEYSNGKQQKYISYDDKGRLVHDNNYKDGLKHGMSTSYVRGNKFEEVMYENDKRNGVTTKFHDNGAVKETQEYKDGKTHGKCIGYYDNGVKSYEGDYEYGKSVGKSVSYNEDGSVDNDSYF